MPQVSGGSQPMTDPSTDWILLERFCQITGYTEEAVKVKRKRGIWPDGIITVTRGRRIHVNLRRYEAWVEGQKLSAVA
jgi:hypothetical protein